MDKTGFGASNKRMEKFFGLLGKLLTPEASFEGLYSWRGKAFVELHQVTKDVDGWKNSSTRMLKLFRLYTIPKYRKEGCAASVIGSVKEVADAAGVVIFLRANGFEFLQQPTFIDLVHGWDRMSFPAMIEEKKDVLRYWNTQPRLFTDNLWGEYSNDVLCDWYVKHGFLRWFCGRSDALNTGPAHSYHTDACLYCPANVRLPGNVSVRLRKRAYSWEPE